MNSLLKYVGILPLLAGVVCLIVYKFYQPTNVLLIVGMALEVLGIITFIITNKLFDR